MTFVDVAIVTVIVLVCVLAWTLMSLFYAHAEMHAQRDWMHAAAQAMRGNEERIVRLERENRILKNTLSATEHTTFLPGPPARESAQEADS